MSNARSFLGAGDIYINRQVDGVAQGVMGPFKADAFKITPKVDTKKSTSKGRDDYGQVLESVNLAQPTEFQLDLKEVTGDVLTMAFLGIAADLTEAAGTLNATATISKIGAWVPLGKRNLDEAIAVTNEAGTTTYHEGTDYELNRPLGWIRAIAGGAITAASTIKATGAYDGFTGTEISGSVRTEVRAELVFDGINQADGSQCIVDVYEAVLSADSAFDFLADDFGKVSLKGTLKTPTGKTAPYKVKVQKL